MNDIFSNLVKRNMCRAAAIAALLLSGVSLSHASNNGQVMTESSNGDMTTSTTVVMPDYQRMGQNTDLLNGHKVYEVKKSRSILQVFNPFSWWKANDRQDSPSSTSDTVKINKKIDGTSYENLKTEEATPKQNKEGLRSFSGFLIEKNLDALEWIGGQALTLPFKLASVTVEAILSIGRATFKHFAPNAIDYAKNAINSCIRKVEITTGALLSSYMILALCAPQTALSLPFQVAKLTNYNASIFDYVL